MLNPFSRTQLLLGRQAIEKLSGCRVAVFGVGGVGGYVCEALVRSGVGAFDLIDDDQVCLTNLNRQIIATRGTMGRDKVDVMRDRMLDINPDADIRVHKRFVLPENVSDFPFDDYDYVVDAVDTVSAKLCLAEQAQAHGVPIISAMGAGNKLDPTRFRVSDISQTHTCPLARVMRRELRKRGILRMKVVWSDEEPLQPIGIDSDDDQAPTEEPPKAGRRQVPGSTAFVPATAGLILAGEVIRDLTRDCPRER